MSLPVFDDIHKYFNMIGSSYLDNVSRRGVSNLLSVTMTFKFVPTERMRDAVNPKRVDLPFVARRIWIIYIPQTMRVVFLLKYGRWSKLTLDLKWQPRIPSCYLNILWWVKENWSIPLSRAINIIPIPSTLSCGSSFLSLIGLLEVLSKYNAHPFWTWTFITSFPGRSIVNGESLGTRWDSIKWTSFHRYIAFLGMFSMSYWVVLSILLTRQ